MCRICGRSCIEVWVMEYGLGVVACEFVEAADWQLSGGY